MYTYMATQTGKVNKTFQVMGIKVDKGMGEEWKWSKGVEDKGLTEE